MTLDKILISFIFLASVSADILQNPDFELPPPRAAAAPFFPVNGTAIPGWSSDGVVQYVTFGPNSSVPQRGGHGVALGQDGKINQTFIATGGEKEYLLTFALTRNVSGKCDFNASVVVSAPDSSALFGLTRGDGKQGWEVYGHRIGGWGNGEPVNLVIQSGDTDADDGTTCWPVVDGLQLVAVGPLVNSDGNLLRNGGFELGPSFPDSSNEGVLLNSEPSLIESALPQWTVTGTVKYINATSFFVPQGKAAVELVSRGSGVQTVQQLTEGSNYNMEFMLGDANDSCSGDFTVGVVAGSLVQNFTVISNGTGSASKYRVTFQGSGQSTTQIGFQSYTTRQSEDGALCGPVIDGVVLHGSGGCKLSVRCAFLVAWLLVVVLMMISE